MKDEMLELFNAARNVSVPLMAIRTADQAATAAAILKALDEQFPAVSWDAVRGLQPMNGPGKAALAGAKVKYEPVAESETIGFVDAMIAVDRLPRGTVVLAHNAHRQLMSSEPLQTAAAVQAVANLRNRLKLNFRMLVLLAPEFVPPSEIAQDIVVTRHALPSPAELAGIVREIYGSAKLGEPDGETVAKAVDALSGLSHFSAEQETAMSLRPDGVDLERLWERKRVTIEQTRGLKVYRGRERFSDIVGLDNVKDRARMRIRGRSPIGVVVFMDEVDKVFANLEHDTSGVRMDQFKVLLTEMEDSEWEGLLLAGAPGGGKSLFAKAFGNEAGVPTVSFDLGGMEDSLVGSSEGYLRSAISVIKAIGQGRAYFVMTSNNATVMRPEMQRRLTGGFFFVDLMSDEQRVAAWRFYMNRYGLPDQALPDDKGWSAAEIRNCAREAWNSETTLLDAARFVVPVALARAPEIEAMRYYAHGRYLDANRPGVFDFRQDSPVIADMLRGINIPTEKGKVN